MTEVHTDVFVALAHEVFVRHTTFELAGEDVPKSSSGMLFAFYKNVRLSNNIIAVNLGGFGDVPSHSSSAHDGRKGSLAEGGIPGIEEAEE